MQSLNQLIGDEMSACQSIYVKIFRRMVAYQALSGSSCSVAITLVLTDLRRNQAQFFD